MIAQHFPGLGSVDRPPYDEVSTIQKTLDQLEQIELAPYFSLTGDADPQRQVDGLMISAVRFQGLQGNIRATTKPVNFDKTALEQLLSPEPLASWRQAGGLTIAIVWEHGGKQFFASMTVSLTPWCRPDGFLAGNDILYLMILSPVLTRTPARPFEGSRPFSPKNIRKMPVCSKSGRVGRPNFDRQLKLYSKFELDEV